MEVAAGTWCNKCMAPAQLAEQSLLLTSCCHIICENCVREMGDSYARDVTFCAACNADCRAATITRQNFASQSDEIQDVLAPRASEAILDQAMQRVARIESFKRQQFRDQIIVQQQQSAKHMQMLEHLRRDNEQLQQQYQQLRQENKRLARSSGGYGYRRQRICVLSPAPVWLNHPGAVVCRSSRPMTSHSTGAEDGFFGQSASSRPRTQSAERSSRPRTQSAERSGRPHTSRTAGLVSAAPSSSPSLSTFARPHTRGGSSMKGSQLLHQTPPRRPYTVRCKSLL